MNIEIVAIGNEILSGHVVNTNAAYISDQLLQEGWEVARHTVLPDNKETMCQDLKAALNRNDLVITTGGLGPTCDDLTRCVAAEIFHSDFRFDEEVAAELKMRYGENLFSIQDQATVPTKARILKNSVGTAPGLVFQEKGKTLILLPGVPPEMRAMWSDQVVPYLRKYFPQSNRIFRKQINFLGLPESTVDVVLRDLQIKFPDISYGIYPGQMVLRVDMKTAHNDPEKALHLLNQPYQVLIKAFGNHLFDSESGKIEESVHRLFLENKKTLALAESCTGGRMASRLTLLSGASNYFLGSIIAYSNQMKRDLLGVSEKTIQEKGAVSAEVVSEMLRGLFLKTHCDYAVACTGIAGPTGGSAEKPVGTIWCGVAKKQKEPRIWLYNARGNREMVIERGVNVLLGGLCQYMAEHDELR